LRSTLESRLAPSLACGGNRSYNVTTNGRLCDLDSEAADGSRGAESRFLHFIHSYLVALEHTGKLNPFAKWAWFARQFRAALAAAGDLPSASSGQPRGIDDT